MKFLEMKFRKMVKGYIEFCSLELQETAHLSAFSMYFILGFSV